ncbi:MAG: exodeoxyribonuclease III [Phycisphaerales bacterium]|jgi:exodeoxyribonuclease-3|nr:exodeoxyribonuclease III [Phycisphaerales bacterium]MDP7520336.1 exodeoxyribonuclease III [Phycisphaerales bacterium]|tara:strand:- start:416 stop:1183 length:768 start_codon:yes stop_codon:yes gene_type:complete
MKVLTWNINGLRSAIRKGIGDWIDQIAPDVIMLQEIRCRPDQVTEGAVPFLDWHAVWNPAERPGYAGTAIFSRMPMKLLHTGIDAEPDPDGRVIRVDINGVDFVSVYLPSGSSSDAASTRKNHFMNAFAPWMKSLKRRRRPIIIGGDLNIARDERDIFHWKSNQNTSGFLPHERAWMNGLIDSGWRDLVRQHAGDIDGPYTWWSNRGRARQLDRGWRIDYLLGNKRAAQTADAPQVQREAGLAISDHAPITVNFG